MTTPDLFLGLDLSTQQLKAAIITGSGTLVHEDSVHFDRDLTKYGTTNGALAGEEPGERYCPVGVWIEAVDLLFQKLKDSGKVEFGRIHGIGGAAQQHGSVYWSADAAGLLSTLDPSQGLNEQLASKAFSTPKCPIWQDSSTTEQCRILEDAIGGPQVVSDVSGSRAYERFTGPQIMKLYEKHKATYDATSRISLVSSFLTTLFLCQFAPIEVSDASGMNLMNVTTLKWDEALLLASGGKELRAKLGPEPVLGGTNLGSVGSWWVQRYGFAPECIVSPFTGDNPSTVVSLSSPGDAIVSLGTSTTLLVSLPPAHHGQEPAHTTTSHLLSHPTTPCGYIAMLCYKNGALAREEVRNLHAEQEWSTFNDHVLGTPPGNDGYLGFYFPLHEIIPPNVLGTFYLKDGKPIAGFPDKKYHARAILESQFLSIRSRVESILAHDEEAAKGLKRLLITGGSSQNEVIRQLAADIMGLDAYVAVSKEGGSVGGALLGLFAWWKSQPGNENKTFEELKSGLETGHGEDFVKVATPHPERTAFYGGLIEIYRKAEEAVVKYAEEAPSEAWHEWK